jgi:hypothetical protein
VAPEGRLIKTAVPLAPGDEAWIVLSQNWPATISKYERGVHHPKRCPVATDHFVNGLLDLASAC